MKKNIILFINSVSKSDIQSIKQYQEKTSTTYRIALIRDRKSKLIEKAHRGVLSFECNLNKATALKKILGPYQDQIIGVVARGESNVTALRKIIPHVPYSITPTESSLLWATDKLAMRGQLTAYDKTISPAYAVVEDASLETRKKIAKKVGFPLVVKPTGLASSLLVSICYHEEELEKTLKKVFKKIQKVYKESKREEIPKVLVESFMEGEMYSIDGYVNSIGKVVWCPLVHVKTGKEIGFDDFFGYQRITPTTLKETTQDKAKSVALQAVHALGLRNTTAHIELMRTNEGWKVIELGARVGGFRNTLYELSHGINHSLNDIRIRIGDKPIIPKKRKAYAAVLKFFAKEEGNLTTLKGVNKIKKLASVKSVKVHQEIGDMCLFAKHGGKGVCDVTLSNVSRSELLADIRRIEKRLVIEVERSR